MAVTNAQGLPRYFPSPDCEIQFGFKRAECKPQMARFLPDLAVTLWSLCRNSRLAIQTTTCATQTAEPSERGKGSHLIEKNPIARVNDHISQDMPSTLPTAFKRHAHGDNSTHEAMGTAIGPKVFLLRTSLKREPGTQRMERRRTGRLQAFKVHHPGHISSSMACAPPGPGF